MSNFIFILSYSWVFFLNFVIKLINEDVGAFIYSCFVFVFLVFSNSSRSSSGENCKDKEVMKFAVMNFCADAGTHMNMRGLN